MLFPPDGKTFKTRDDFSSVDEYAHYVKENIKVGLMVKCCEAYEEVRHGDIGRVMKVHRSLLLFYRYSMSCTILLLGVKLYVSCIAYASASDAM